MMVHRLLALVSLMCLLIPQAHWLVPHHHHDDDSAVSVHAGSSHGNAHGHAHYATAKPGESVFQDHIVVAHDDVVSEEGRLTFAKIYWAVLPLDLDYTPGIALDRSKQPILLDHVSSGCDPPRTTSGLSPPVA